MIEERKPDASSHTLELDFSRRFRGMEMMVEQGDYPPIAWTADLLACIREQQAALEDIRKGQQPNDYAKPLVTIERLKETANEVLARWRIE